MIDDKSRDLNGFVAHPRGKKLSKISGKIKNYVKTRDDAIFVFTENDKNAMGVVAISAALAGLGGQATSVAANASSMEESADYVEFEVNTNTIKGWLWRSPFGDGDDVHVAVEWQGEYYEIFGISRPLDRTIALYPHCSRSKVRHFKNAIKWWVVATLIMICSMFLVDYTGRENIQASLNYWNEFFEESFGWYFLVGMLSAIIIPVIHLTLKWMPFVRVAEKVFTALELPNASNIDLVKSSKMQRTPEDPPEFGSMYFRY
jgi:hypothetical protein